MDWTVFWSLIESFSGLFYEPVLFWGVPLLPAIALETRALWQRYKSARRALSENE